MANLYEDVTQFYSQLQEQQAGAHKVYPQAIYGPMRTWEVKLKRAMDSDEERDWGELYTMAKRGIADLQRRYETALPPTEGLQKTLQRLKARAKRQQEKKQKS